MTWSLEAQLGVLSRCRAHQWYLVRCYLRDAVVLLTLLSITWWLRGAPSDFGFQRWHLVLPLFAVPFGWWVSSVMHNTGHGNFPRGVNRVLGEFAGAWLGYGLTNFTLIHSLHHAYADHEHDPVSPRGHGFVAFLLSPMGIATQRARRWLRERHGHKPAYEWTARAEWVLFQVNVVLRGALWLTLFGPSGFVFFYVVSLCSNVAILAHINFACHRDHPDGSVEVVDLEHGLYYRLANAVTAGGYFHRSHHAAPGLLDPRTRRVTTPMFTVEATRTAALDARTRLDGVWGAR